MTFLYGLFGHAKIGLGGGVAWRDLWISLNLDEAFKIQMGRMYVPLTRNCGTTSTKAILHLSQRFTYICDLRQHYCPKLDTTPLDC